MAQKFRTESDSMGDMKVPADALYGASTQRAVENFPISGLRFSREFIQVLAAVKQAAAQANLQLKTLDAKVVGGILSACRDIESGAYDHQFVLDIFQTGSGTSTNMNFNEVAATLATRQLQGKVKVHPNDHVNRSQSSNDVFPTAMHVAAALGVQKLLPALAQLEKSLQQKAKQFAKVVKMGRTHLQDATPLLLGQEFSGYAEQVKKSQERIEATLPGLYELAIGGTAVGTGINAPKKFGSLVSQTLAKKYKLPFREAGNHFEAQATKDACVFLSAALKTTAVSLFKIANDIRLLGSGPRGGLAELRLPSVQPGSSIMPGKVNPVIAEALIQVCAQVIGNDSTISWAGAGGHFELNAMMPVMTHNLLQSLSLLSNAVSTFESKCIRGIEAETERLSEMVERSLMLATPLALSVGYDKAAKIAKQAHEEGKTIREVAKAVLGLPEKDLDKILAIEKMLHPN